MYNVVEVQEVKSSNVKLADRELTELVFNYLDLVSEVDNHGKGLLTILLQRLMLGHKLKKLNKVKNEIVQRVTD